MTNRDCTLFDVLGTLSAALDEMELAVLTRVCREDERKVAGWLVLADDSPAHHADAPRRGARRS